MSKTAVLKAKNSDTKEIKVDPALASIEALAEQHATAYGELYGEMVALQREMDAAKMARIA